MSLEFQSFANAGDLEKERIILKALSPIDVGVFAVFRSSVHSTGDIPTAGRKMLYWFPDKAVAAGDLVVLYTKTGAQSAKVLNGGATAHFFYWGKAEPLWGNKSFGAVIAEFASWTFKVPGV